MKITKKLLVVDDEKVTQTLIKEILEDRGFAVDLAGSGEEALQILKSAKVKYSVIILDYMMPAMSGLTVLNEIKQKGYLFSTKVIMATAIGTYNLGVEAIKSGATNFLVKPFEAHDLVHMVDNAMNELEMEVIEADSGKAEMVLRDKIIQLSTVVQAGVSLKHEIGSPLQSILAAAQIMAADKLAGDNLEKIEENIGRVHKVIEKFVHATNVETKKYLDSVDMIDIDSL